MKKHFLYFRCTFRPPRSGPGKKEKEERLLSFLSHVEEHGDSFLSSGSLRLLVEYKYVIPRGTITRSQNSQACRKGHRRSLCCRQSRFLAKGFFPGTISAFRSTKNPFPLMLRGKKFYFIHGDGLALKDTGYRFLKKILRNKFRHFFVFDCNIRHHRSDAKSTFTEQSQVYCK